MFNTSELDELFQILNSIKGFKLRQPQWSNTTKLFYEVVKLAWGLQVAYCYHDLIYMITNYLCYDLYENDNGWGMGLGAKDQNADVCALAEILKEEDDDENGENEEKEEEEDEEEKKKK